MKLFLLILFFIFTVSANDALQKEIKIHDIITQALFPFSKVALYTNSQKLKTGVKSYSKHLTLTHENDAQYIILNKHLKLKNKKALLFVTDYSLLKDEKSALGAFYWKKGRPTIIFIKERLEAHSIILPKSLTKYSENEKCLYELCF